MPAEAIALFVHAGTAVASAVLGFNRAINSTEVCAAAAVVWALAPADANSATAATPPQLLHYIYLIAFEFCFRAKELSSDSKRISTTVK